MALIRNIEPDLTELVGYVIARSRERRVTLNRARLVKLLYLVDVESVRTGRDPVTGVHWMFLEHGPHADELVESLRDMDRRSALYRAAADDAPDAANWVPGTRRSVDGVVERFAALALNELLDHVYFHSGPMRGAVRGEALDIGRARDDPSPRRSPPLRPPARREGVQRQLELRRGRAGRRVSPASIDPAPATFDDRGADLDLADRAGVPAAIAAPVRGRLHVPVGCEL